MEQGQCETREQRKAAWQRLAQSVKVRLRMTAPASLASTTRCASPQALKGRLLLVEDDRFHAKLLVRWLETDSKMEIVVAETGHEGMRLSLNQPFDVLLTDINLPGPSGLQLVRESKSHAPERAAILITAEESVAHAVAALRLHADDILFKPLTRSALTQSISQTMERVRAARGLQPKVVLAVGAHPDDVEIGCGGILKAHRQAGDQVVILTLSRGKKGGAAEVRAEEAARAARALDASLVLADLEDTRISEGPDTIAVISQAIARHAPSVVYTHSPHDVHQDHRNTFHATMVAARSVPSLFCYQSPSSTIDFHPTYFVDISSQLQHKLDILALYRTQAERRYLEPDLLRATARYWGRFGDCTAVEPLEVIRASL